MTPKFDIFYANGNIYKDDNIANDKEYRMIYKKKTEKKVDGDI